MANEKRDGLRHELMSLDVKRQKIESDIKGYQEILASQRVGMDEPLVDSEGFPRNDIDVMQVRTARSKIRSLENDAMNVMMEMESKLHELHALNPSQPSSKTKK